MARRIGHICKVFLPTRGGIQTVVDSMCRTSHNVSSNKIITTSNAGSRHADYPFADVDQAKSYGEVLSMPLAPSIVTKIFALRNKTDLVYVHYPFPIADAAIALFGFLLPPTVVYWHSNIVSQRFTRLLVLPLTALMLLWSKKILIASPNMLQSSWILNRFKHKCLLLPYGLDVITNDGVQANDVVDKGFYLCVGRHVEYKGFEYLIRAIPETEIRLLIVGSGPLYEQHLKLIETLGLEDQVVLLPDVDDEEKQRYFRECRALILSSVLPSEAFALVQLEAMRHGKPIINTDLNSGVPWVARNGQEAITVAPKDSTQLSQAITRLEDNPDLRRALGAAAKQRYEQMFTLQRFKQRIAELESQIL